MLPPPQATSKDRWKSSDLTEAGKEAAESKDVVVAALQPENHTEGHSVFPGF